MPGSSVGAVLLLGLAACSPSREPEHLRGLPATRATAPQTLHPGALRYQARYGEPDGSQSFSIIGAVAAATMGRVAAYDASLCRFAIFNINAPEPWRYVGRCGAGPGEFGRVIAAAFKGDTLLTVTYGDWALRWITLTGHEVRRMSLSRYAVYGLFALAVFDDSTLAIAVGAPGAVASTDSVAEAIRLVRLIRAADGSEVAGALQVSTTAAANPMGLISGVAMCAAPPGMSPALVVMNQWAFEGVVLRGRDLHPSGHFITALPWATPRAVQDPKGQYPSGSVQPGPLATGVACLPGGAVYWALKLGSLNPPAIGGGRLELRTYAGELLVGRDFGPSDTLLHGRPVAASDDAIIWRASNELDYPQLLQFQLVQDSLR